MATLYRHNTPINPYEIAIRATRGSSGPEDTFTALVAYALSSNPDIAREWANLLLSHVPSQTELFDNIPVEVSIYPYSGSAQPDFAITLGNRARIVFEHKLDSPEGVDQIHRYLLLCEKEERQVDIPHFLAFVAPKVHNLVGDCYKAERFVKIGNRHPLWSDLGGIIEERVEETPGIRELYELFDYMNLLPFEIPDTLEPLLREGPTLEDLGIDAIKARRWFHSLVRKAGNDAIERGWLIGSSWIRACYFEPPKRVSEQHPQLRWLMFEAWPRPRTIRGVRMPVPSVYTNISYYETKENDASREIEGLMRRFSKGEIGGYTPEVAYSRESREKRSIRLFWMSFDLNKIWADGDLETFIGQLVPELIELYDPPLEGE